MLDFILSNDVFVKALSAVIVGLVGWGLKSLSSVIQDKRIKDAVGFLGDTIESTVKGTEQTLVAELKAANADGKLTNEEKVKVKQAAIQSINSQLNTSTKALLAMVFDDLNEVIDKRLEASVIQSKAETYSVAKKESELVSLKMISKE